MLLALVITLVAIRVRRADLGGPGSEPPVTGLRPALASQIVKRNTRLTIIAATGEVSRELLEQAVATGHDVTAVVRDPRKLSRPGAHRHRRHGSRRLGGARASDRRNRRRCAARHDPAQTDAPAPDPGGAKPAEQQRQREIARLMCARSPAYYEIRVESLPG